MKLDISENEVRVQFSGANEGHYTRVLLERLIFVFNPQVSTWVHGVKVEGKAKQVGTEEVG